VPTGGHRRVGAVRLASELLLRVHRHRHVLVLVPIAEPIRAILSRRPAFSEVCVEMVVTLYAPEPLNRDMAALL